MRSLRDGSDASLQNCARKSTDRQQPRCGGRGSGGAPGVGRRSDRNDPSSHALADVVVRLTRERDVNAGAEEGAEGLAAGAVDVEAKAARRACVAPALGDAARDACEGAAACARAVSDAARHPGRPVGGVGYDAASSVPGKDGSVRRNRIVGKRYGGARCSSGCKASRSRRRSGNC